MSQFVNVMMNILEQGVTNVQITIMEIQKCQTGNVSRVTAMKTGSKMLKITVIQTLESASNVFLKLKETIVNTAKLDFLVTLSVACAVNVNVICLVQIRPIMIVTE